MSESIQALCQHYASQRGAAPFTTAQCFDQMKNVEDMSQISDALGRLYRNGTLARRKIDNVRNEYVWAKFADASYEVMSKPRVVGDGSAPAPAAKKPGRPRKSAPAAPEIPMFLKKEQADAVKNFAEIYGSPQHKKTETGHVEQQIGMVPPNAEAIADTLLAHLGEMLAAQRKLIEARIDNAAASSVETSPGSRLTVKIERIEIRVEGL